MALPFIAPTRAGNTWLHVGPVSDFPDITESGTILSCDRAGPERCPPTDRTRPERPDSAPERAVGRCGLFTPAAAPTGTAGSQGGASRVPERTGEDVLVFRYRGTFHAIANRCPHAGIPLAEGGSYVFDVEDFGVALSAGIACAGHGWAFDLFSGRADRAGYKLGVWDVQVREGEVWVRRKVKVG